jgi:hypothetical protein
VITYSAPNYLTTTRDVIVSNTYLVGFSNMDGNPRTIQYRSTFLRTLVDWNRVITTPKIFDHRFDCSITINYANLGGGGVGAIASPQNLHESPKLPSIANLTINLDLWDYTTNNARFPESLLYYIVKHEVGHCLGIGDYEIWPVDESIPELPYTGVNALDTYRGWFNLDTSYIWIVNEGGHLLEGEDLNGRQDPVIFDGKSYPGVAHELMTPILENGKHAPLSIITANMLQDMGFTVDTSQVEYYVPASFTATFDLAVDATGTFVDNSTGRPYTNTPLTSPLPVLIFESNDTVNITNNSGQTMTLTYTLLGNDGSFANRGSETAGTGTVWTRNQQNYFVGTYDLPTIGSAAIYWLDRNAAGANTDPNGVGDLFKNLDQPTSVGFVPYEVTLNMPNSGAGAFVGFGRVSTGSGFTNRVLDLDNWPMNRNNFTNEVQPTAQKLGYTNFQMEPWFCTWSCRPQYSNTSLGIWSMTGDPLGVSLDLSVASDDSGITLYPVFTCKDSTRTFQVRGATFPNKRWVSLGVLYDGGAAPESIAIYVYDYVDDNFKVTYGNNTQGAESIFTQQLVCTSFRLGLSESGSQFRNFISHGVVASLLSNEPIPDLVEMRQMIRDIDAWSAAKQASLQYRPPGMFQTFNGFVYRGYMAWKLNINPFAPAESITRGSSDDNYVLVVAQP